MRDRHPAALARPVEDLGELAARINEAHAGCLSSVRQGLLFAREAGLGLLEAKRRVGHGKWLAWLRDNTTFSSQTASVYLRVAGRWDELPVSGNLTLDEALDALSGGGPEGWETPVVVEVRPPSEAEAESIVQRALAALPPEQQRAVIERQEERVARREEEDGRREEEDGDGKRLERAQAQSARLRRTVAGLAGAAKALRVLDRFDREVEALAGQVAQRDGRAAVASTGLQPPRP